MNSLNEPFVSVIVPIYNVEKYLEKCILSLTNQTYTNIEIILVNDGSTDNCGTICDRYARIDSRIKVIHQQNKGLSAARNIGLKTALGEILFFVDSDDSVTPDFCTKAVNAIQRNKADLVCFGVRFINAEGKTIKYNRVRHEKLLTSKEAIRQILSNKLHIDVWCKAFRRELFDNLSFPEGYLAENVFIIVRLLDRAKKIVQIPDVTYNYLNLRPGSICQKAHTNKDEGQLEADSNALMNQRDYFITEHYPQLIKTIEKGRNQRKLCLQLHALAKPNLQKLITVNEARTYLKENLFRIIFGNYAFIRQRGWILLYLVSNHIARKVYPLYGLFRDFFLNLRYRLINIR
jgi:glycosyltransferase involved in cell wall biosynthesis